MVEPGPIAETSPDVTSAYFDREPAYNQDGEDLFESEVDIFSPAQALSSRKTGTNLEPKGKARSRNPRRRAFFFGGVLLVVGITLGYLIQHFSTGATRTAKIDSPSKQSIEQAVARATEANAPARHSPNTADTTQEIAPALENKVFPDVPPMVSVPVGEEPDHRFDEQGQAELAGTASEMASTNEVAEPEAPGDPSSVTQVPEQTFLVNFPFDSDKLIPDSHHVLDSALVMLKENPDSVASITGFADNRGDKHYNLDLSVKRAMAVQQYLVDAGIAQERLLVEGRGVLTDPVEVDNTEAMDSMQQYRIVQIKIGRNRLL
jgi:outer membrane protein OmpA-like peptidoglycan-associated protein